MPAERHRCRIGARFFVLTPPIKTAQNKLPQSERRFFQKLPPEISGREDSPPDDTLPLNSIAFGIPRAGTLLGFAPDELKTSPLA